MNQLYNNLVADFHMTTDVCSIQYIYHWSRPSTEVYIVSSFSGVLLTSMITPQIESNVQHMDSFGPQNGTPIFTVNRLKSG